MIRIPTKKPGSNGKYLSFFFVAQIEDLKNPIGSKLTIHVGKYTIHGSYGNVDLGVVSLFCAPGAKFTRPTVPGHVTFGSGRPVLKNLRDSYIYIYTVPKMALKSKQENLPGFLMCGKRLLGCILCNYTAWGN